MNKPTNFKKYLRKNQTNAETILWRHIRNRQLQAVKFRRQVQFDKYIVDFACFDRKLIIEIDGGQHNEESHRKKDITRDQFFTRNGFKVLRFWNTDVIENIEGVVQRILDEVSPHPNLLPQGEKEPGTKRQ